MSNIDDPEDAFDPFGGQESFKDEGISYEEMFEEPLPSGELVLSEEQMEVLDDLVNGRNMLITGAAGTGKSFLLNHMQKVLAEMGKSFGVCGSTGVSAVNIGGVTLHSWAGLGLGDGPVSNIVQNIRNNKPAYGRVRYSKVVCIDEISMISGELFGKLDKVFRMIREKDVPFGGIQLILFGDLLQLPAVEGGYVFESPSWWPAAIKTHLLTKVFRQKDVEFSEALGKLRIGLMDQQTKDFFNARANIVDPEPHILPVSIVAKNVTADMINERNLNALEGEMRVFHAVDTGSPAGLRLLEKCLVPKELKLKVGARVMCLVNMPDIEVMNGSAGTVCGFSSLGYPIVDFDNGVRETMETCDKEVKSDGNPIGKRKQFPLRLSWACSTHKIQGQTLDKVEIHLGEAFCEGQIYVALSRVRTKEGLFIKSLNKNQLTPNKKALDFYANAKMMKGGPEL